MDILRAWAPVLVAVVTTAVNLILSFSGYLNRREAVDVAIERRTAVTEVETASERKRVNEKIERLEDEVQQTRDRMHELANRCVGDIITKLTLVETRQEFSEANNAKDHDRFDRELADLQRTRGRHS